MQPNPRQVRISAYKLVAFQVVIACCASAFFAINYGALAALSALKGGIIAALTNLVFALVAFRTIALTSAEHAKNALMRGHSLKLILTIVLFVVVLKQEVAASAFITGFIMATLAQWSAAVFFKH